METLVFPLPLEPSRAMNQEWRLFGQRLRCWLFTLVARISKSGILLSDGTLLTVSGSASSSRQSTLPREAWSPAEAFIRCSERGWLQWKNLHKQASWLPDTVKSGDMKQQESLGFGSCSGLGRLCVQKSDWDNKTGDAYWLYKKKGQKNWLLTEFNCVQLMLI